MSWKTAKVYLCIVCALAVTAMTLTMMVNISVAERGWYIPTVMGLAFAAMVFGILP